MSVRMFLCGKRFSEGMICHYYLTYECNCRCDYCPVWKDAAFDISIVPSVSTVEVNLSSLKRIGCVEINFTGGEPLLYGELPAVARMAKERGFFVSLSTNGLLSSKKMAPAAAFLDRVYVSLDYPAQNEHDSVKAQECFLEALDTIDMASSHGIEPVINYSLSRDSIRFLPELMELAQEKRVKAKLSPVHHCPALEGYERISLEYISRYAKNNNTIFDRQLFELLKRGGVDPRRPACRIMDNLITISPDDHIILPCIWAGQAAIPINGDLENLMTSDIVKGYRTLQGTFDVCRGCLEEESIDRSFGGKVRSLDLPGKARRAVFSFMRGE